MEHASAPGERGFLQSLRAQVAGMPRQVPRPGSGLKLGIGDDCAILRPPPGHEVFVTTDLSLETVHFQRNWHTPESAGHRCLARGLSDLAAMGAQPLAAFLSLALPIELVRSRRGQPSWRERFLSGLLALANHNHVTLAGGDTAQSPPVNLGPANSSPIKQWQSKHVTGWALADIVLVGSAPRNRALLRSQAKEGDAIYVTGHLGGAAAELAQLAAHPSRFRKVAASSTMIPNPHPHLFPEPRLKVGAWLLRNQRASAAIDISDGLSTDLNHLCEESNMAAVLDASLLPLHPLLHRPSGPTRERALQLAIHGGEDYELLFTASPDQHIPHRIAGVPIARIGEMRRFSSRKPRMLLREQYRERPLRPAGWEYYR